MGRMGGNGGTWETMGGGDRSGGQNWKDRSTAAGAWRGLVSTQPPVGVSSPTKDSLSLAFRKHGMQQHRMAEQCKCDQSTKLVHHPIVV